MYYLPIVCKWGYFENLMLLENCFLFLACKGGYFGKNCSRVCSPNCKPDTCQHKDGKCTSCAAGWTGYNCSSGNAIIDNIRVESITN